MFKLKYFICVTLFFLVSTSFICMRYASQTDPEQDDGSSVYQRFCGDWGFKIKDENKDYITVEFLTWGLGWASYTARIEKTSDENGVKVYSDGSRTFTNDHGAWKSQGHMCSDPKN